MCPQTCGHTSTIHTTNNPKKTHLSMAVKQRPMSILLTSGITAQISLKVRWLFSRFPATKMHAAYTALLARPRSVLDSCVCTHVVGVRKGGRETHVWQRRQQMHECACRDVDGSSRERVRRVHVAVGQQECSAEAARVLAVGAGLLERGQQQTHMQARISKQASSNQPTNYSRP